MSQFFNAEKYIVSAVKGLRKQQETEPVSFKDSGEAMSFALNTLDSFRTLGIKGVSVKIKAIGNGDTTIMTVGSEPKARKNGEGSEEQDTDEPTDDEPAE